MEGGVAPLLPGWVGSDEQDPVLSDRGETGTPLPLFPSHEQEIDGQFSLTVNPGGQALLFDLQGRGKAERLVVLGVIKCRKIGDPTSAREGWCHRLKIHIDMESTARTPLQHLAYFIF
jgi:hypothetical protein